MKVCVCLSVSAPQRFLCVNVSKSNWNGNICESVHSCHFGQQIQRGRSPVEHRGNLCVRTFTRPSFLPPQAPQRLAQAPQSLARASEAGLGGQTDGRMDGRTDGCTHRFPLCSTGLCPLWVCCPKELVGNLKRLLSLF